MEFVTAQYRTKEAEGFSLLLQHYEYKGEQICFACMAEQDFVSEGLYQWFRQELLVDFMGSNQNSMKRQERRLRKKMQRLTENRNCRMREKLSVAFLLCVGQEYLAFEQGSVRILCLNTAFGKSHLEYLQNSGDREDICSGSLEEDVAFLITTHEVCQRLGEDMLREVLFVREAKQEWQLQKRLGELIGEKGEKKKMGAIWVRSCRKIPENMQMVPTREDFDPALPASIDAELVEVAFSQGEKLGEGAFSKVRKVKEQQTGKIYACKKSGDISMLWREYCVGKRLDHPVFPKMYEFWQDGEVGYLLMEYVPGDNVKNMLERRGRFSVKQVVRMGMELAEGLLYLHEQAGFLFRDVKPENIIIRQDGRIKLLDLGCVCRIGGIAVSRAGTPGFAAPEQFDENKILDVTCDVHGLARSMEEMLGTSVVKTKELKAFLKQCTDRNPKQRIPDMRMFLNLLGEMECSRRRRRNRFYKQGVLCYKNIWERSYKTLDVL